MARAGGCGLVLGLDRPASAVTLSVEIAGIDGDLERNVRTSLGILQEDAARMSESRLRRLHLQAQAEIEQALRPFGFYAPRIETELTPVTAAGWRATASTPGCRSG